MNTTAVRANRQKLAILAALVLLCAAGYMLVGSILTTQSYFSMR